MLSLSDGKFSVKTCWVVSVSLELKLILKMQFRILDWKLNRSCWSKPWSKLVQSKWCFCKFQWENQNVSTTSSIDGGSNEVMKNILSSTMMWLLGRSNLVWTQSNLKCYTSSQKTSIAINIKACSIDHGVSQNALIVVLIEPHLIEIIMKSKPRSSISTCDRTSFDRCHICNLCETLVCVRTGLILVQ